MPAPKTHYRIALGEHNGEHSWIIHSAKGIKWHNIPKGLSKLLKSLNANDILDFELGSDGKWYVRYSQKGEEKQQLSSYLWMDLGRGNSANLDRLTLGPDAEHWGVHRTADGSLQRFSSVDNPDKFTKVFNSKIQKIQSNSQIWFVSLGFNGSWAFSVNGFVQHHCGKPFHAELASGWMTQKRVSNIVLSPMAFVWIIIWDDGTLSHNLPSNIANEVEDYCQVQHSLKAGSNQQNSRPQKTSTPQNGQPATSASAQKQQSSASSADTANKGPAEGMAGGTAKLSWVQISKGNRHRADPASTSGPGTASTSATPLPAATSSQPIFKVPAPIIPLAAAPALQASSPVKAVPTAKPSTKARSRKSKARQKADLDYSEPSFEWGWGDIYSTVQGVSVEPELYVLPKKLSTTLRLLDPFIWPDSVEHEKVTRLFEDGWKHQHKNLPKIKRVLAITLPDHLKESYQAYKDVLETQNGSSGVNEQLLFHGTVRNCSLGDAGLYLGTPCEKSICSLCCILRASFLVSKVGSSGRPFKRFGDGIYTSSVSSKADDYASAHWPSDHKVMIVAKAALGKSSIQYRNSQHLTAPPQGYDSVFGEVGVDLNYDEQVLYKNEAIRPAYIVVYERPSP